MKSFKVIALGIASLLTVSASGVSQSTIFALNTSGIIGDTNVMQYLTYDSQWFSDEASAESIITVDGIEIARRTGCGDVDWMPQSFGTHILTYQTFVNGVAVGEGYTRQLEVVNVEGMGEPGLQRVTFTGSVYSADNVALGMEPMVTTTGEGIYDTSLGQQMTYAYTGYMYFCGGETYPFRGYYDDYSSVHVDGKVVVAQHTGDASGMIKFEESGWHKVDFRVSNNTGASGPTGGVGIQYMTDVDPTWRKIEDDGAGLTFRTGTDYCGVQILSARMRPSDPTIMDIVYKVTSPKERVNVRAIAYEDGNRSFKNAVPILTFADGTGANIGDDIPANVEQTLSWQVAADWATDLTKVRVEILVREESLLPLHFVTIPKTANHAAVQYSDTVLNSTAVMNALLWLYASQDDDLYLANGVLSNQYNTLCDGTTIKNEAATVGWLYAKMGYSVLAGNNLNYVNAAARINLVPNGLRQFAVKTMTK